MNMITEQKASQYTCVHVGEKKWTFYHRKT